MQDVEFINPMLEECPNDVELTQPSVPWLTPGVYLAQKIFGSPLVRFVGERYERDYLQTVVVLDDDPDELLDRIFTVEQKMFQKFGKLMFDVRVRVIPKNDDIDLIMKSSVTHISKDDSANV